MDEGIREGEDDVILYLGNSKDTDKGLEVAAGEYIGEDNWGIEEGIEGIAFLFGGRESWGEDRWHLYWDLDDLFLGLGLGLRVQVR